MQKTTDLLLQIPEAVIDQLADRVAAKVIARLRPLLEKSVATPARTREPDPDRPLPTFLRLRDIVERTGLARSTIYSRVNEGRFPASVSLGGSSVAWRRVDVEEWERDPKSFVVGVE